jgi:hypothetical protein
VAGAAVPAIFVLAAFEPSFVDQRGDGASGDVVDDETRQLPGTSDSAMNGLIETSLSGGQATVPRKA